MERINNNDKAGSLKIILCLCFALATAPAAGSGLELDGASNTSLDTAPNGVPIVNIARPNPKGLSHNTYRQFNVDRPGLILNNSTSTVIGTQIGGQIFGNPRLGVPARVILNEVTSVHRSRLDGYTEVAGPAADVVIANPNGISVNGAGFINAPRVTLTTGKPGIDADGSLRGFDVLGGDIAIEGQGLDTARQDSTSVYTHYLNLNAKLHARDLDIVLGKNQVDYPGRKIVSVGRGNADRVLLDSSALGGMYANKIVLVGTDQGLGMNLPPKMIASGGNIEITNAGRLVVHKIDAGGNLRLRSNDTIQTDDTVYAAGKVAIETTGDLDIDAGTIGAGETLAIDAGLIRNDGQLVAGLDADAGLNDRGFLSIEAAELNNRGEIASTEELAVDVGSVVNHGLLHAFGDLRIDAVDLSNRATLFSGGDMQLFVQRDLGNGRGASIFALDSMVLAADAGGGRSREISNDLGLVQTLRGDIDIHADYFENLGDGELRYELVYFDLGNGREVDDPLAAMTIDLEYNTGYTKHRSTARRRWVNEVLNRLSRQAPLLYADNAVAIGRDRSARFLAIETRMLDYSTTDPAYLDSGNDLNLNVGDFVNRNSVTAAARDLNLNIAGDYRNEALSASASVTDYQYSVRAKHRDNWKNEDRYSSVGRAGYIPVTRVKSVSTDTVTQAGRDINGTIGGQAANDGVRLGEYQASGKIDPAEYAASSLRLPSGDFGLFVEARSPDSTYLIETNPRFASFSHFVSSSYLLDRLDFSAHATLKRLGDAFYESKLVRDSVFAQTGRRFLDPAIHSDNAQFQYLMDNALLAQAELELAPGIELTRAQIDSLTRDIVWLVRREIAGRQVLVPTVYLASGRESQVRGGRIVAGGDTGMVVASLANDGLVEAGDNLELASRGEIHNRGVIGAGGRLELDAVDDIDNVSGRIAARDVTIESGHGDILHRRATQDYVYSGGDIDYSATLADQAGQIEGTRSVALKAAGAIEVSGSDIDGGDVVLEANSVDVQALATNESYFAGSEDNHVREAATLHFASRIGGDEIVILSSGASRVSGSSLEAAGDLRIQAGSIEIGAVNDSEYYARLETEDDTFGESIRSRKSFRGRNRGSELSGTTVVLVTESGDIELRGSRIAAAGSLRLDSAGDIRIDAGHDESLDESYKHESGWFSGGSLYEETEDLEGRTARNAVKARLDAGTAVLSARGDVELRGVDISVGSEFAASAENIALRHATDELRTYSKHTEVSVSLGDVVSDPGAIDDLISVEDGKLKLQLGSAEYENAEHRTRRTSLVASALEAENIHLDAGIDTDGDITVEGSAMLAAESIALRAGGDVAVLDAHDEIVSEDLRQQGSAVASLTFKNEYEQVARMLKAVREAERDLERARDEYDDYRDEVRRQREELERLEREYASGTGFIERADINEFERRLDRMEDDDEFYEANIALAAATLASKTTALVQQTGRAASSSATYGFNMGIELDIDALENQLDRIGRESRASTLSANRLSIDAGDRARLRGSNLLAGESLDVSAGEIDIAAGRSTNRSSERERQVNLSYSWDLMGGASTTDPEDLGGGFSGEGSEREGATESYRNSQLLADNVRLHAGGDTTIRGADVAAADRLEIVSENLEVSSVQDISWSDSQSRGLSWSRAGAGANESEGYSEQVQTRVTRLSGAEVDIAVGGHTDLQGAVIASVDAQGADNRRLRLSTETLSAGSLNNTSTSDTRAVGLFAGETSTLDFGDDSDDTKTRSLATVGHGDIYIADEENSDTRFLNTDIGATEVAIYDIESHRGLSGELDTRLLSEAGRNEIAEDFGKTKAAVEDVSRHIKTWVHNVPDGLRVQVGEGLEQHFDNLILNGYEPDQISSLMHDPDMIEFLRYALELEKDFVSGNYVMEWDSRVPLNEKTNTTRAQQNNKNEIVIEIIGGTEPSELPMKYKLNETLQTGYKVISKIPPEDVELALRLVDAVTGGPAKLVIGEMVSQIVLQAAGDELAQVKRFVTEQTAEYLNEKPDGYYRISPEERREKGVEPGLIEKFEEQNEVELGGAELGIVVLGTVVGTKTIEISINSKKSNKAHEENNHSDPTQPKSNPSKDDSTHQAEQFVYDSSADRYRSVQTGQFAAARNLPWPDNAGFVSSSKQTLEPGKVLDRYGKASGRFLGEPGATISQRGMAQGTDALPYTQYKVLKSFEAQVGPAAPVSAFGASGGATQYLPGRTVEQLVKDGFLEVIK